MEEWHPADLEDFAGDVFKRSHKWPHELYPPPPDKERWGLGIPAYNLHLLCVDWRESKTKILRELHKWFERHWSAIPAGERCPDEGGRKHQYFPWLVDLAIYRASESGLTRNEAMNRMNPLFAAIMPSEANKLSPPHWADAKRKTKERLKQRRGVYEDFFQKAPSREQFTPDRTNAGYSARFYPDLRHSN